MAKKLSTKRPKKLLHISEDWITNEECSELVRTIKCSDFLRAFMLVTRISIYAEVHTIYPIITLKQKSVKIQIASVSNKLTPAEIAFAKRVDEIMLSTSAR